MSEDVAEIMRGLSTPARLTIKGGAEDEWYARTDYAAEELVKAGLVRQPFVHDRRILVPNVTGRSVRAAMQANTY